MKHAILILAHKQIEQLYRLIRYFNRGCDVLIHIYKKVNVTSAEKEHLFCFPQVKLVEQEYEVNRGGTSVLEFHYTELGSAWRTFHAST
ncbi:MAG: hypothetical protein NC113_05450 [Bacteroides sp.]|nr:hypothetical protein [Bacteroides sp.]MCM1447653.1 hypothetical protein [Bacteroides sp.]